MAQRNLEEIYQQLLGIGRADAAPPSGYTYDPMAPNNPRGPRFVDPTIEYTGMGEGRLPAGASYGRSGTVLSPEGRPTTVARLGMGNRDQLLQALADVLAEARQSGSSSVRIPTAASAPRFYGSEDPAYEARSGMGKRSAQYFTDVVEPLLRQISPDLAPVEDRGFSFYDLPTDTLDSALQNPPPAPQVPASGAASFATRAAVEQQKKVQKAKQNQVAAKAARKVTKPAKKPSTLDILMSGIQALMGR